MKPLRQKHSLCLDFYFLFKLYFIVLVLLYMSESLIGILPNFRHFVFLGLIFLLFYPIGGLPNIAFYVDFSFIFYQYFYLTLLYEYDVGILFEIGTVPSSVSRLTPGFW